MIDKWGFSENEAGREKIKRGEVEWFTFDAELKNAKL